MSYMYRVRSTTDCLICAIFARQRVVILMETGLAIEGEEVQRRCRSIIVPLHKLKVLRHFYMKFRAKGQKDDLTTVDVPS